MIRDNNFTDGIDHFLDRPVRRGGDWLVWFVLIGGAVALLGFLALLAGSYGLI
jgi:hypothetical protein